MFSCQAFKPTIIWIWPMLIFNSLLPLTFPRSSRRKLPVLPSMCSQHVLTLVLCSDFALQLKYSSPLLLIGSGHMLSSRPSLNVLHWAFLSHFSNSLDPHWIGTWLFFSVNSCFSESFHAVSYSLPGWWLWCCTLVPSYLSDPFFWLLHFIIIFLSSP